MLSTLISPGYKGLPVPIETLYVGSAPAHFSISKITFQLK